MRKGNKIRQNRRRTARQRYKPERQETVVRLIDGNVSKFPIAYCLTKKAYLTRGLADCHQCTRRHCPHYQSLRSISMNKTKIDWCDCTVNPVVGCPNGCEYCYAHSINDRFHFVPNWNEPQFFPEKLKQFNTKKPHSVFIDSMSDIGTWKKEWFEQTLDALLANPQHRYIALTKTNTLNLNKKIFDYIVTHGKPIWLYVGKSITTQAQADAFCKDGEKCDFLSIEPLLEPFDVEPLANRVETIIIGAETGRRADKVIPQKEWIDNIVKMADKHFLTVFMKESLREIMGDEFRQDKLPWKIQKIQSEV